MGDDVGVLVGDIVGTLVGAAVGALVVGFPVGAAVGGMVAGTAEVGDPMVLSLQTQGIKSNALKASQTSHPASKLTRQQAEGVSDNPQ